MEYTPRKLGKNQLAKKVKELRESIRMLKTHSEMENWTATTFLTNARISFRPSEVGAGPNPPRPPDIAFRDANFEIKEVQDSGRKRGDEYKEALEYLLKHKRVQLKSGATHVIPNNGRGADILTAREAWDKLIKAQVDKATERYRSGIYVTEPIDLGTIDLLVYFNSEDYFIDDAAPDSALLAEASAYPFRSICVTGNGSLALVLKANADAPEFLKKIVQQGSNASGLAMAGLGARPQNPSLVRWCQ
jgi:hypothetical protein